MEPSSQINKPKYSGTQGTLLVAKNDDRITELNEEFDSQPVNLDQPALIGLTPPFTGRRFALRTGKTAIGRREDNDIVLADGSVSSLHAWVIEDNGSFRLMNILSTNGSFVNNERITETLLKEGDHIRFGGVELQLHTGLAAKKASKANTPLMIIAGIAVVIVAALALWIALK